MRNGEIIHLHGPNALRTAAMRPDAEWRDYSSPLAASPQRGRGLNTRDDCSSSEPGRGSSKELG